MGGHRLSYVTINTSPHGLRQDSSAILISRVHALPRPVTSRCHVFLCRSVLIPVGGYETPHMKLATISLQRSYDAISRILIVVQLIPAIGIVAFAVFGLEPLLQLSRILFLREMTDKSWKRSSSHHIVTSYLQPLLLWTGVILICRALDPLVLPSETSQVMKQSLLSFARSLSTVLTFAYCSSSLIQEAQKFFIGANDSTDARNMSIDFAGKAIYAAVWFGALSLFMELLGFSMQKWLTAGGLGTILLTLAGCEVFTNFLSSVMIHATRPFVENERIKTKIQGYEVSGKVERVAWWSPTIVRGADCEAVYIPNHKLSVNVVQNLSKKSHWRIKIHLAISHLDVSKINKILSDMRKVLAKNPQVEQRKLHKRVFLEGINPENQALMILVSCFVKTSHSEECLCVKEAILWDLLRIITYHQARLATPIRTVQKAYSDGDLEIDPFDNPIFTRSRAPSNNPYPFLVIDPPFEVKASNQANEKKDAKIDETLTSDIKGECENLEETSKPKSSLNSKDKIKSISETKMHNMDGDNSVQKTSKLLECKTERAGTAGKGTVPRILSSSNESGREVTTSVTQQLKLDEEKSALS